MAGHSQFKNIMYRKGAQDAKRAKVFSKLSREITVAAKLGTPEPDKNPRLRLAIQAARKENMPKDNIERAIKKAAGGDGENYEEVRYEGFGPSGIGIIVEALTDNRNRTAGDVRAAFTKNGGNLGETGSVSFMFDRVGSVLYKADTATGDEMLEAAVEAGADDCLSDETGHEITCAADGLGDVRDMLEARLGEPEHARIVWKPQNVIEVDDEVAGKIVRLLDTLDDHDDVQNVYANFEMSEAALKALTG